MEHTDINKIEIRNNKKKIKAIIANIADIKKSQIHEMYNLHKYYYERNNEDTFINDLMAKNHCILIFNEFEEIVGFITAQHFHVSTEKGKYGVIYFGDTILMEKYRGAGGIAALSSFKYIEIFYRDSFDYNVWYLPSSGFLTYKFLCGKFKKYYPSPYWKTPGDEWEIMKNITNALYGDSYRIVGSNPLLIEFDREKIGINKLIEGRTPTPPESDPIANFFASNNPNWVNGCEMICIGYITKELIESIENRYAQEEIE